MIKNYKIAAEEYVNNGGGNMVMVYTVWLPDEKRELYVNVDEENTIVTTVNHIGCSLEIDDYCAITLLTIDNFHWYQDGVATNTYASIAARCYAKYLRDVCGLDVTAITEGCYAEASDITFIMDTVYINGELFMSEVIGWYYGMSTDEDNDLYGNRNMAAFYR